jgi:transcriptional regulator with XRE-family HTH domain
MINPTSLPDLNSRRKALKMPVATVVRRSGVSPQTVYRILRGKWDNVRVDTILRVAAVLGISLEVGPVDAEQFRREEAQRKARLVGRLTQGTMALEAQAVSPEVLVRIEERIATKLLAGSGKKLWSD